MPQEKAKEAPRPWPTREGGSRRRLPSLSRSTPLRATSSRGTSTPSSASSRGDTRDSKAPQKVTGRAKYTFDVNLPGMLWGRMVAGVGARRGDRGDRHLQGRGPSRREGGLDHRIAGRSLRGPGRGRGRGHVAGGRGGRGPAREGDLQGAALRRRPQEGDGGGRAPRVRRTTRPRVRKALPATGTSSARRRPAGRRPRRHREGLRRGRRHDRGDVLRAGPHPRASRDPRRRREWEGDQLTIWASTQGVFTVRDGVAEALGIDRKNVTRAHGAHGRRLREQAVALGHGKRVRGRGLQARQEGGRAGEAHARPSRGAPLHRQRSERLDDGPARRQEGRNAHGHPLPLLRLGGNRGRRGHGRPGGDDLREVPERQDRGVRRLHERGPAAPSALPATRRGRSPWSAPWTSWRSGSAWTPWSCGGRTSRARCAAHNYDVGAKAIGWERRNKRAGEGVGAPQARDRHGQRQLVRDRSRSGDRRPRSGCIGTAAWRCSTARRTSAPGSGPPWPSWPPRSWDCTRRTSRSTSATRASPRGPPRAGAPRPTRRRRPCAWPRTRRERSCSPRRRRSSRPKPRPSMPRTGKSSSPPTRRKPSRSSRPRRRCRERCSRLRRGAARSSSRPIRQDLAGVTVRRGRGGRGDRPGAGHQDGGRQ